MIKLSLILSLVFASGLAHEAYFSCRSLTETTSPDSQSGTRTFKATVKYYTFQHFTREIDQASNKVARKTSEDRPPASLEFSFTCPNGGEPAWLLNALRGFLVLDGERGVWLEDPEQPLALLGKLETPENILLHLSFKAEHAQDVFTCAEKPGSGARLHI